MAGMFETAGAGGGSNKEFKAQLNKVYGWYTGGFAIFVVALAILEQMGLSREWIGFIFLLATIGLYAGIGIMSRTTDAAEYYVAGRRVPAVYNGMATGADWMSAASFIGMAGTLYLTGYSGLAFIMGWTGGYCLVALFLAPYLRKFGQFTIPDFLGERYGGNLPRFLGIFAAILCSFTYVVAQIYGVGLITSRLTGVAFELGIFLGLGGILVCSFLGGMRAVTWTQVAQYIILIVAYMIPVVWLSVKQTSVPVPQAIYGAQLEKVTAKEKVLIDDPKEKEVRDIFKARSAALAEKLKDPAAALAADKAAAEKKVADLKAAAAPAAEIAAAEKALADLPKDEAAAKAAWTRAKAAADAKSNPLNNMPRHAAQFSGDPNGDEKAQAAFNTSRLNFLALIFCLMVGTAALPHILMRFFTTPSVKEARKSVGWSLFFIFLLYFTAPAYAAFAKLEVYSNVIGQSIATLPAWVASWTQVGLVSVCDATNAAATIKGCVANGNGDGILQLAELMLNADAIVLATPEIAGLPYVIAGLVAAGGLAAALSTADGLLLTISNALSHDVYYKMVNPNASAKKRLTIARILLLGVAAIAAFAASNAPATILSIVAWAFSIAAASFFPALVLGIFWKRANKAGAVAGMLVGFGLTLYYLINVKFLGMTPWFGIKDVSAGIFGIPLGFITIWAVSLMTAEPSQETKDMVEDLRYPKLAR